MEEDGDLFIPGAAAERVAMDQDDWRSRAVVLVVQVNRTSVFLANLHERHAVPPGSVTGTPGVTAQRGSRQPAWRRPGLMVCTVGLPGAASQKTACRRCSAAPAEERDREQVADPANREQPVVRAAGVAARDLGQPARDQGQDQNLAG